MASEDVIELGSSEDEAEPKKMKPRRNAMVCIPGNLQGVTVKKKPVNVRSSGSAITVKKFANSNASSIGSSVVVKNIGSLNAKNLKKTNGKSFRPVVIQPPSAIKQNKSVNPLNMVRNVSNGQVKVDKLPSTSSISKIMKVMPVVKPLSSLPPSITVKKTVTPKFPKIAMLPNMGNFQKNLPANTASTGMSTRPIQTQMPPRKKRKLNPAFVPKEVLTVELDDDESSASSAPPWYIRPEEHAQQSIMEAQNNAEPKTSKPEEILIEDSPVKPVKDKRMCEVEIELPITIEDSPAKGTPCKENKTIVSDEEEGTDNAKERHSKKKLEYPKDSTIEIEIYPMEVDDSPRAEIEMTVELENDSHKINETEFVSVTGTLDSDIEFCNQQQQTQQAATPKQSIAVDMETVQDLSDFHPVYQSFIDLCFKLENSDDMKKIVEKKIKAYYKQVPKDYTESEQFLDLVSSKISLIKASPEKMYLYIKDIVDELNLQRKMLKSQTISNIAAEKKEAESFLYGEESEFDSKRQRQIRKLEKTLKKLHRAIQKLEEQEVDFDDEEDSVYLLTERYKERMVRVHAKFCQLTNTKMPSEPRIVIEARPGQPSGPARRIEKWINKKVPIGTPLPFPDFHDVLRCVREANDEDKLGWNEADIMEEARDLFTRCGKKLQRRRQENEWRLAASRISTDNTDPAEVNETLKKKLDENRQVATKKETEVFNKFADRQCQLKLEAEEIGDKEAEESPVESEEEELENSDLGDKERRKERLKRLIQEKSIKKVSNEKLFKEASANETETITGDVKESSVQAESSQVVKIADSEDKDPLNENDDNSKSCEKVETISEESNEIGSDVDELHLLQKLHSENEVNTSTLESSDTDTPIDISDTLDSGDNIRKTQNDDVISIENSSYSETEQESTKCISEKPDTENVETRENEIVEISTENVLASSEEENCDHEEKNAVRVELGDKSSIELRETTEHCSSKPENTIELMTLSEEENTTENYFTCSDGRGSVDSSNTKEKNAGNNLEVLSVELCENSSIESVDAIQNKHNESEKSAENNCEIVNKDLPSIEVYENLSIKSAETMQLNHDSNSADKIEAFSEDENNGKKDNNPPSIELCESSSVELCENTSPSENAHVDFVDPKNNEVDNNTHGDSEDKKNGDDNIDAKKVTILEELSENVKDKKTCKVIDQTQNIQEIEIAYSPSNDNLIDFVCKQDSSKNQSSSSKNETTAKNNKDLIETNDNSVMAYEHDIETSQSKHGIDSLNYNENKGAAGVPVNNSSTTNEDEKIKESMQEPQPGS